MSRILHLHRTQEQHTNPTRVRPESNPAQSTREAYALSSAFAVVPAGATLATGRGAVLVTDLDQVSSDLVTNGYVPWSRSSSVPSAPSNSTHWSASSALLMVSDVSAICACAMR